MKTNPMKLRDGNCVVCGVTIVGNDLSATGGYLSPEQNVFFGVPAGRTATYALCSNHAKACLKGAPPSGFPNGELLIEAIRNAVESYDYAADKAEEKRIKASIENQIAEAENLCNLEIYKASLNLIDRALADMQRVEWDKKEDFDALWLMRAEILIKTGKHAAAIPELYKSLQYRAQSFGEKSQQVLDICINIANAHVVARDFKNAIAFISRWLDAFKRQGDKQRLKQLYLLLAKSHGETRNHTACQQFAAAASAIP